MLLMQTPTADTNDERSENSIRLDAIELKLMDLEHTVQTLDDIVIRQDRTIERLNQRIDQLQFRLEDSSSGGETEAAPTLADELPPHY